MTPSRTLPRAPVRLFAATFLLALALIAPAASHASAWVAQQSVPIVNGRTAQPAQPQIGVDAAGNAVMAMLVDKGPPQYVQVAGRPVGGDWGAATELGTVTLNTGGPALAVDPSGHALIAWVDSAATAPCTGTANACLHVVSRSAAGAFTTETLFTNGGTAMFDPAVALDPSGNGAAVVVWRSTPSAGQNIVQSIRGTIGGTWSAAANVGSPGGATIASPRVAITAAGIPVVMYFASATFSDVMGAYMRGTTWTAPASRDSSTAGSFANLTLKTNAQGDVDAVYVGRTTGNRDVRTITFGSSANAFSSMATIYNVANTHTPIGPRMETAADGEAVAVWTDDFASTTSVRSVLASVRTGGTWSGPVTLDPDTVSTAGPALAMDGAGNATAVWHTNSPTQLQRYAVHPHGGSFGTTLDGPAGNSAPVAAADNAGHVHAAWALGSTAVDTAVFDPVPPTISAVAANPLSLLTGNTTQLDVTGADTWSGPVTIHWDFGDGQSADGASVTHAFSNAGTFAPKAVATDAAGNSSSSSGDVTVTQAQNGPPPLARPIAGKTVNLEPVTGDVLVKVPGSNQFVPLVAPTQVRDGSIIDARKGRVRITIDNGRGGLDTADFYGGIFKFTQPKVKAGQTWFANLYLYGGSFKGCPTAPKNPKVATLSKKAKKQSQGKSVRHLWGSGEGAFRTVGRFSSATVRGTTWLTDDKCNGTLTKVTAGKVGVRDFVLKKTVLVKRGKTYFAQPKPRKKR